MRSLKAWTRRGWDLLGIGAAIAFALPSLWYPFAGDQGLHWYLGKGIWLGEVPYTNAVSSKPPSVFVVHAASIGLLGDRESSIRVFDLAFILCAGVLVATFRRRLRAAPGVIASPPVQNGEIGAACLLLSGLYYTFFDFNDTAHPTLWQGVAMLASGWVIARAPGAELSWRAAFLAGFLACLSVTFGQATAIGGVVLGATAVGLGLARRRAWEAFRSGAAFTAGVATLLVLTVLPFILTGTFGAFWNVMFEFMVYYAERAPAFEWTVPPWMRPEYGGGAVAFAFVMLAIGLAVTGAARNRGERRVGLFAGALAVTALVVVAVMKRALFISAFNYYFIIALPFLGLIAYWGLRQRFSRKPVHQLATVAVLVALAFFAEPKWATHRDWSYRAEWESWLGHVQGERTWAEHHAAHYRTIIDSYVRQHRVGTELARIGEDGDTMCADGFVPVLYYLSGMRCTSRFIVGDIAGGGVLREEHERSQRERPPNFIVTFSDRRPRIRELEGRGYTRYDIQDGRRPWYVIMRRGD